MSEQNNRRGRRQAPSQRKGPGYWKRYKAWLAGLTRGQRIRYRVLETATILSAIIIVAYLGLSAWMRLPDLPGSGSGTIGGLDGSGVPVIEGAEAPDISKSGRKDGVYTFLLAGKDVASGGTDTILLLSYDTRAKTIHGLNLPRDTMINTKANSKRINAVYSRNRGPKELSEAERVAQGMDALKKEVANLTGITPDYYILVEWEAIGELVDAIGGVKFDVPFDMDYDDPAQDLYIHQKAGLRELSGSDAMQVIRWRKNNSGPSGGDVARLKIQQDFLKAVAKKCLQPATFLKIPALAEIFAENVTTDLSVGNILAFAQRAYGMSPDEGVSFATAPLADAFRYNKAALVTLDAEGILTIVNEGMNPYLRDIEAKDLRVVYRRSDGSFGVTNGELLDPKMGQTAAKPSKPEPKPKPEPEVPVEPELPAEPDGGDVSQPDGSVDGSNLPDGSQQPPAGGDSSQGGTDTQTDPSGEDVPPVEIPAIDPDQVLPDPNEGADASGLAA